MKAVDIPVVAVGPGSQPAEEDGAELDYMPFPGDMAVYRPPQLPEPEELDAATAPALAVLDRLQALLAATPDPGQRAPRLDLTALAEPALAFLSQALGVGEVSVICEGPSPVRGQETALAGVWRLSAPANGDRPAQDWLELGRIPQCVLPAAAPPPDLGALPADPATGNAQSILAELAAHAGAWASQPDPERPAHVINLSLLPLSDADQGLLAERLGLGPVTLLSRGYGNCRIQAVSWPGVWRVQFFNAMDTLILDTLEVTTVPAVACAAPEDLADSVVRLAEILEVYR